MSEKVFKLEIIPNDKRKCNICNEFKTPDRFSKSKTNYRCKNCMAAYKKQYMLNPKNKRKEAEYARKTHFKKQYGITIQQYQEMLLDQNGVCAICSKPELIISRRTNKPMQLCVDHCHTTGKVRSLLCNHCNKGLGNFKEDKILLKLSIDYLEKHGK